MRAEISRLSAVWRGLGLVLSDGPVWSAGSSSRSLLPAATALAHLWEPAITAVSAVGDRTSLVG